jgi:hypothetical protein
VGLVPYFALLLSFETEALKTFSCNRTYIEERALRLAYSIAQNFKDAVFLDLLVCLHRQEPDCT